MERSLRFLRYLPEFGYQPCVLTTSAFGGTEPGRDSGPPVLRAWEPLGLYRRLFNPAARRGAAASYVRTEAGPLAGRLGALPRRLLAPDAQVTWLPAALACALRHLRTCPVDLLYSTSPPASAHLVALLLKRLTGTPWAADFRDAWTTDPLDPVLEQMPRRRRLEERLEGAVVRQADAVIAATSLCAEDLRRAHGLPEARVRVITNGFDPDEVATAAQSPPPPCGPLRIVHTGAFSTSHPRRSPGALFRALEELVAADPAWAGRMRLVLAGPLTATEQANAAALVRAGVVELAGVHGRAQALSFQAGAHVLLLLDHPRDRAASNVPGKFYEYLGMRRPILTLSGPGMVARLTRELGAGVWAPADDPEAIRAALVDLHAAFCAGHLPTGAREESLRPFHARALARQLADCFDHVVTGAGHRP
ncbi:MAG: glycosyltransferase [Candidatus Latescibacterota bacterium]